jgi:transposase
MLCGKGKLVAVILLVCDSSNQEHDMTTNSHSQDTNDLSTLYMSIELSASTWKLGFTERLGRRVRVRTIPAGAFASLEAEIAAARRVLQLAEDCPVVSCYEAGRDGFWVHRCLISMGIESYIVEPSSIEVNRKMRRAKTDRIDAEKIATALVRFKAGDRHACRMNRIPEAAAEDARNMNRELKSIKNERTVHTNRIRSLLACQGISDVRIDFLFPRRLDRMKTGDGQEIGCYLRERLLREFERLKLAVEQIRGIQKEQADMLRAAARQVDKSIARCNSPLPQALAEHLVMLGGIGPVTAWTLATEIFSWRDIKNRRQLGALAGLVPTPHSSGDEEKEQGISKSGRGELRALMIEIAWGWLKFQPDSELSKWYRSKFGKGTKRSRKIGIVALARKLLVALGKYVRDGEVPIGARLKKSLSLSYVPSLTTPQADPATAAA